MRNVVFAAVFAISVGAALFAAQRSGAPSPSTNQKEVIQRMLKRVQAAKCLHLNASIANGEAEPYALEAWMTATRLKQVVRRNGAVVFATTKLDGVVEVFSPRHLFRNGEMGENILVQYDGDAERWPVLVEQKFACNVVGTASETWLKEGEQSIPAMWAAGMQDATMTEDDINGRRCYRFRTLIQDSPGDSLQIDLFVDQETFDVVRKTRAQTSAGKREVETIDYAVEMLPSDAGVKWHLDRGALKAKGEPGR